MPGFRTRNPLKAAIAILGYALIGLFALVGVVTTLPTLAVLAVGMFIVVMLAFDAYGLRRRIPGLRADSRALGALTWFGLIALIIAASIAADSLLVSPDERLARDARASAAGAARSTPEPGRTAAEAVPSAATTPSPSTVAAIVTPSPIATSTPALTSPPSTPSPTPLATATPAPPTPPPATPQPVPYQVIQRKDASLSGRTRTEVRIVVPGQLSTEQKIATLAAAARNELRANVVLINAFRTPLEERECTATVGQAELSTDGRGWNVITGETLRWGMDNREIQGSVATEIDERACATTKEERFSVPR